MDKDICYIRLLLFFLTFAGSNAYAQKTFRFEHITVNEGLSQSGVKSLAQDALGYLWIGTQDGLNRYDGYSFKIYRNKQGDSASLIKNYIGKIFIDKNNTVWVATLGYLSKYNQATDGFTNYPIKVEGISIKSNAEVKTIIQRSDGEFVLATSEGLIHFNSATEKFYVREAFKSYVGSYTTDYQETKRQGDWVFFTDSILHRPYGQKNWEPIPKPSHLSLGIYSVYDRKTDALFVRTSNSLLKYDGSGHWIPKIHFDDISSTVEVLFPSDGNIWVVTEHGLGIYTSSGKLIQRLTSFDILSSPIMVIGAMYETRDGIIWLGTNGYGLAKYNLQTNRFSYIGTPTTSGLHLSNSYVDAIFTPDDTTLYVSTPNGLDILNLYTHSSKHFTTPKRITHIRQDDQKQLWLYNNEWLSLFKNNKFTDTRLLDDSPVKLHPSERMAFIAYAKIAILDQGKKDYLLAKSLEQTINTLQIWGDTLWVGMGPGSSQIKLFKWSTKELIGDFSNDPKDPRSIPGSAGVKCFFRDAQQRTWIGSNGGGLSLFNPKEKNFTHYTEKDGLPNNTVYGILEDNVHHLWLSTNKGLCEFDPALKITRNFEAFDGLQSNEFNTGAAFKSKSGTLYFGGVNGLTYFHPRDIDTKNTLPQSVISAYYINNKPLVNYSDHISASDNKTTFKLGYTEHDFGFDFVGVGFSLPGRTKYRYTLKNYDREWHDIGNLQHINFTNIPPGQYVFRVKSSDPQGNWEKEGVSTVVLIDAPFWRKPWVWIISGSIFVAFIFTLNYLRINSLTRDASHLSKIVDERTLKIQKQNSEIAAQNEELLSQAGALEEKNKELEKAKGLLEIEIKYLHQRRLLKSSIDVQEDERKRIAQDLHDELGAVLSIARMHLVQIQEQDGTGLNMKSALQQARTLTESALATMRRISHELMPPQLEKFGLVKTLRAIVTQTNAAKQIELSLSADDDLPRWGMPVELGLYRVCMELINNTLKHANAKTIRIQLKQGRNQIMFSYSDDGMGLPEKYISGHGFKNIEARVSIMVGTITMGSSHNGGFEASLVIPVSVGSAIPV